ncbi:MAG TPA: tetratricopeptide repeat protein [Anaerolineae bacterium]|nr:tetratricopeptide repeat protein [Anaerolineae bacterium]
MSDTSTTDLVQQGLAAARVGDIEDARRLLQEATRQMPDNVEAWLGLAGVVASLAEKEACFNKVLVLDPANSDAKAGLALVRQKQAQTTGDRRAETGSESLEPVSGPRSSVEIGAEAAETGLLYCYRHPQIQTGLRCNRCNKPICPKCARRTPVGFRCPDCIREQEDKYYSGGNLDYVIAAAIALPLSLIAAGLFTFVLGGFGFFIILIGLIAAPAVAGFIAEAVRWGVGKRRSRYLGRVVAACIILGTIPFLLILFLGGNFYGLLGPGIFIFLGTATVLARLR